MDDSRTGDAARLRRAVLSWYRSHARDLPWRRTRDPYAILVSEIMLQQTQVDRVIPRYRAFLRQFPSLRALARARLADVLRAWSGLGYNRRACHLWECARTVASVHGGRLPRGAQELAALPGIGRYTAGAVASVAFGLRTPAVDVNVRRVLARSLEGSDRIELGHAWDLAHLALPPRAGAGDWNQALMDVGALFCRPAPKCDACPARSMCRARASGKPPPKHRPARKTIPYEDSRRYFRGRIVHALTRAPSIPVRALGEQVKEGFAKSDEPWLLDLLRGLAHDGLIVLDRRLRRVRLA